MRSYTVTEFTTELQSILHGAYDDMISISGEVSGLTKSTAGHIYFDLKDSSSKIRVLFFKNYNIQRTAVIPKNGDSVEVSGNIDLYLADGSYSIKAVRIVYKSEGLLYLKFIEVRNRLEARGLFDEAKKKPIPKFPKNVALLTSIGAAALNDFLIAAKKLHTAFDIEIHPAAVQGMQAKDEILAALKNIEKFISRYDVLVITRGGGSAEDLAIFNDEDIALAVSRLSIPVISAVGHERDFTILDFVSDKRVATPTAAATLLTENYSRLGSNIANYERKLNYVFSSMMDRYNYRLDIAEGRLNALSPEHMLARFRDKITINFNKIRALTLHKLALRVDKLTRLERVLLRSSPDVMINNYIAKLANLHSRLNVIKDKRVTAIASKLDIFKTRLELLDPYNVLDRGYAIVSKNNKVISNIAGVKSGDIIDIRLKSGEINCNVIDSKELGG